MPPGPRLPSLDGCRFRIARAREHIEELRQAEVNLASDAGELKLLPNTQAPKALPDGRTEFYSDVIELPALPEPDPRWAIYLGEALYNLRSAIDYLVYELALLDSGREQDQTQFPISPTAADFTKAAKGRLCGVMSSHVRAIEALQPYHGDRWLEQLADISNPDKHRHLVATAPRNELLTEMVSGDDGGLTISVAVRPRISVDDEAGTPVVEVLASMAERVANTIEQFARCFPPRESNLT